MPQVSIITAVYNSREYIRETVQSVLDQTFTDWEMIIVDDGSADDTKELITSHFQDRRIHYFYQDNRGQARARNCAFQKCRGDYIAILDHDDLWESTKLQKQVSLLDNNSNIGICYTDVQKINLHGDNLKSKKVVDITPDPLGMQMIQNHVCYSSILLRTTAVTEAIHDEKYAYTGDGYLMIRLALAGWSFGYIREKLVRYRIHDRSMSRSKLIAGEVFQEKKKMFAELAPELVTKSGYAALLSRAEAVNHLDYSSKLIQYGDQSDYKSARANIHSALAHCKKLSVVLRAVKLLLLNIRYYIYGSGQI